MENKINTGLDDHYCPSCGASLKAYWHSLTPGLVKILVKVYVKVSASNLNKVERKHLDMTISEYDNMQKLRFHGLIAKYKENGKPVLGSWLITRRGGEFLRGEIQVPYRVKTFRNSVVAHSEKMVTIKDVLGTEPFFERKFGFEFVDLPLAPEYQAGIEIKRRKRRKNERRCLVCEEPLVKRMSIKPSETDSNNVVVKNWFECPKCKKIYE